MSAFGREPDRAVGYRHEPRDGTFRKVMPTARAAAEVRGWQSVVEFLPVPRLLDIREHAEVRELVYEDVFAVGRCDRLLADAINAADRLPEQVPAVRALVDAVCDSLLASVRTTGRTGQLGNCVPALYADRLQAGGRLDSWYAYPALPLWRYEGHWLAIADLWERKLVVADREYRWSWPELLGALRTELTSTSRWVTAVSQGDATEPNIAEPLCWLDFEHAGRNTLAGDVANLLWYLLGLGGWLVPTYQPETYSRTLRRPSPPRCMPSIERLRITERRIEVDYRWSMGAGRQAAVDTLVDRIATDLGRVVACSGTVENALRPFLAIRLLGVIPLNQMSLEHALLCTAKLAELTSPDFTLADWCRITSTRSYTEFGGVR